MTDRTRDTGYWNSDLSIAEAACSGAKVRDRRRRAAVLGLLNQSLVIASGHAASAWPNAIDAFALML
jgi:hypothetical protein